MQSLHLMLILLLISWEDKTIASKCFRMKKRCSCPIESNITFVDLMGCMTAEILELRDGNVDKLLPALETSNILHTFFLEQTTIIFTRASVSQQFLKKFKDFVTKATNLVLDNSSLTGFEKEINANINMSMTSITLINVSNSFSKIMSLSSLIGGLQMLKELSVISSQVFSVPHNISQQLSMLHALDLSGNPLNVQGVNHFICQGCFLQLTTLKLQNCNLSSFEDICLTLQGMKKLKYLHLSQNNFLNPLSSCSWQQSFHTFNMSSTNIEYTFGYLPQQVEVLDLSNNKLKVLNGTLPNVITLDLSNNQLLQLPSLMNFPNLRNLRIDGNGISHLGKEELSTLYNLTALKAGGNTFRCDCEFIAMKEDLVKLVSKMEDWPAGYVCDSPSSLNGTLIKDISDSLYQCHKTLLLILIIVGTTFVIGILAIVFYRICTRK
ncbi:toll-like receptor 2 [Protopterus annectens]|uniref:toll-like receptor 2 n=1 Tax=Protopterus annectens TaxID=7888 RepID=UPI001CFC3C92|nr:toll-like receptor 2 [Protopterus annectens]